MTSTPSSFSSIITAWLFSSARHRFTTPQIYHGPVVIIQGEVLFSSLENAHYVISCQSVLNLIFRYEISFIFVQMKDVVAPELLFDKMTAV